MRCWTLGWVLQVSNTGSSDAYTLDGSGGGSESVIKYAIGDRVLAFFWTYTDGGEGRWSDRRRRHRVTSVDPLRGIEYWHEGTRYVQGEEHRLSADNADICDQGLADAASAGWRGAIPIPVSPTAVGALSACGIVKNPLRQLAPIVRAGGVPQWAT